MFEVAPLRAARPIWKAVAGVGSKFQRGWYQCLQHRRFICSKPINCSDFSVEASMRTKAQFFSSSLCSSRSQDLNSPNVMSPLGTWFSLITQLPFKRKGNDCAVLFLIIAAAGVSFWLKPVVPLQLKFCGSIFSVLRPKHRQNVLGRSVEPQFSIMAQCVNLSRNFSI